MRLFELCDPLFQHICRLNRSARKGGTHEPSRVRAEVQALLADLKSRAGKDRHLAGQFEKVELPLVCFVDFMVEESALPFAPDWQKLASERKEPAGDEAFFDLLEETLADASPAATERLAVFYLCMGLGFAGGHRGRPEYLRQKMLECSARLRGVMDVDDRMRLCPWAYENVNTLDLVAPPGRHLGAITIALIGLIIVIFIANVYLFRRTGAELKRLLGEIIDRNEAAVAPAEPGTGTAADMPERATP